MQNQFQGTEIGEAGLKEIQTHEQGQREPPGGMQQSQGDAGHHDETGRDPYDFFCSHDDTSDSGYL